MTQENQTLLYFAVGMLNFIWLCVLASALWLRRIALALEKIAGKGQG